MSYWTWGKASWKKYHHMMAVIYLTLSVLVGSLALSFSPPLLWHVLFSVGCAIAAIIHARRAATSTDQSTPPTNT
jgi:hypothetical protein